ncbi:hypothetical protein OG758_00505 [Streptomyces sp. NBC_01474]|nr:hypothetical protein [Streptomyces sp. NBC_01474]WSD92843.1 hypothetical protein OG758_00505 [Streptomyces sp. NBC_01474]
MTTVDGVQPRDHRGRWTRRPGSSAPPWWFLVAVVAIVLIVAATQ